MEIDITKLIQTSISINKIRETRRQQNPPVVHAARKDREGRKWLRSTGRLDHHSVDNSAKPFIAWDGEGITYGDATHLIWHEDVQRFGGHAGPQSYVLFGASTGAYVLARELSTIQCLNLMLSVERQNSNAIHVGFAFTYDANMILKDLPHKQWKDLHETNRCCWNGYRINYIPRKWLQVAHGRGKNKVVCKIFDVHPYFHCSFVKALRTHDLDIPREDIDEIERMKKERHSFSENQLRTEVLPYMQLELKYLLTLMNHFRELLEQADLIPRMWHGPATLSDVMLRRYNVQKHMNQKCPRYVKDASQYAMTGGRIEQFMVGHANCKAYKYDKRSAYPTFLSVLPSLAGRKWSHAYYTENPSVASIRNSYGMYYIRYRASPHASPYDPQPFFHRAKHGGITYPTETEGWYWAPEVAMALELSNEYEGAELVIHKSWILDTSGNMELPFSFIPEKFAQRLRWKDLKIAAEFGLKLALNGTWGKTAQRVGWNAKEPDKIPKWHQYEWAGYVTSATRAEIYKYALLAAKKNGLIACETDAVITTVELPSIIDNRRLGDWECEVYDDIVYLQNGVYWLKKNGEWLPPKLRGMDPTSLDINQVLQYLDNTPASCDPKTESLAGMIQTRFMSTKQAMRLENTQPGLARTWLTIPKQMKIWYNSKRIHDSQYCEACKRGVLTAGKAMHNMMNFHHKVGRSYAIAVPWRKVSYEMSMELQEELSTQITGDDLDSVYVDDPSVRL